MGRVAHCCRWHRERHHIDPRSTLTRNCDISQISALARGKHCLGGMVTMDASLRHGIIGAAGAVTYETSALLSCKRAGIRSLKASFGVGQSGPCTLRAIATTCVAKANQCFVLHFALLSSRSMWMHGMSRSVRTLIDADHSECLVMKITVALGLGKTLLGFRNLLRLPHACLPLYGPQRSCSPPAKSDSR